MSEVNATTESVPGQGTTMIDHTTMHESATRTLALIKPDAMPVHKEAIISIIKEHDFVIVQEQQVELSKEKAAQFYKEHLGKPFYEDLTNWVSSAPIYAMILEKRGAVQAWRDLMGPTNSIKAREEHPKSIRALFGTDGSHNATHGSDSQTSAEREIHLIFDKETDNFEKQVDDIQVASNKPNETHTLTSSDILITPKDTTLEPVNADQQTTPCEDAEKPNVKEEDSAEDEPVITHESPSITPKESVVSEQDPLTKEQFTKEDFIVNADDKQSPVEEKPFLELDVKDTEPVKHTEETTSDHTSGVTADDHVQSATSTTGDNSTPSKDTKDIENVIGEVTIEKNEPIVNNNKNVPAVKEPLIETVVATSDKSVDSNEKHTEKEAAPVVEDPAYTDIDLEDDDVMILTQESKDTLSPEKVDRTEPTEHVAEEKKEEQQQPVNSLVATFEEIATSNGTHADDTKEDIKEPTADLAENPSDKRSEKLNLEKSEHADTEHTTKEVKIEPTEKLIVKQTENLAKDAAEKPNEDSEKSTVEHTPVVEHTEESKEKDIEKPVSEHVEKPTETPIVENAKKPAADHFEKPVLKHIEKPVLERLEKPIVKSRSTIKDMAAAFEQKSTAPADKKPFSLEKKKEPFVAHLKKEVFNEKTEPVAEKKEPAVAEKKESFNAPAIEKQNTTVLEENVSVNEKKDGAEIKTEDVKADLENNKEAHQETPIETSDAIGRDTEGKVDVEKASVPENNVHDAKDTHIEEEALIDDAKINKEEDVNGTVDDVKQELLNSENTAPEKPNSDESPEEAPTVETMTSDAEDKKLPNDGHDLQAQSIVNETLVPTSDTTADADNKPTAASRSVEEAEKTQNDVFVDNDKQVIPDVDPALEVKEQLMNGDDDNDTVEQQVLSDANSQEEEESKKESDTEHSTTATTSNSNTSSVDLNQQQKSTSSSVTSSSCADEKKIKETSGTTKANKVPVNKKPLPKQTDDKNQLKNPSTLRKPLTKPGLTKEVGIKKPVTTLRKPVATDTTTTTKPARVPRVALLANKKATPAPPAEDKPETKPKKAGSTRSLVSRLTAPTAASARRAPTSTVAETPTKKVSSTGTPSATKKSTTATTSRVSSLARPTTKAPASTTTATSTGVRRTSPTKIATTKKVGDATPAIRASVKKSGTRTATTEGHAKPTSSNKKETTDAVKKITPPLRKKLVKKEPTSATQSPPNEQAEALKEEKKPEEDNNEIETQVVHDEKGITHTQEDQGGVTNEEEPKQEDGNTEEPVVQIIEQEDVTKDAQVVHDHDAEVESITAQPHTASLRSKFETLTTEPVSTSQSKELRSKSPNRISDMINRFQ